METQSANALNSSAAHNNKVIAMRKSFWYERRANLLRRGTHTCKSGNIYKMVNGAWWKFADIPYAACLKYPCYIKCDGVDASTLKPRNIKHL